MPEQVWRPVGNEGRASPVLDVGGYSVEVSGPLTMGYGLWPDPGCLPRESPCRGVFLTDGRPDIKGEQQLLRNQVGRGPLEYNHGDI